MIHLHHHRVIRATISAGSPRLHFGPFNLFDQRRWLKPVDNAQTRLENRTRDSKLDNLAANYRKLRIILELHELMVHSKRGPFVSLQVMSRWKNRIGLNVGMGIFINKYPHVFEVFVHQVQRNLCCAVRQGFRDLINEEIKVLEESVSESILRLKKLLMMSKNMSLHVHALSLIRRELGLPEDFRDSVLGKYNDCFRLVNLEIVELVEKDEDLGESRIEVWREKENREKWLSEFETRYAFSINFPTGFKIEAGFKEQMKNWQRIPYVKPYERKDIIKERTCGGLKRFEKRVVGLIHEFLSLTVEKKIEVERFAHFRKDLGMEVNVRELLLKHPGIFYISTKGSTQTVFLREAYSKGCLIEPNLVYSIRRRMLDLILLGCRSTRKLEPLVVGNRETELIDKSNARSS